MGWSARFEPDGTVAQPRLSPPARDGNKYHRGDAYVLSGPAYRTGAARLAAEAALTIGAGLVTVVASVEALPEHAAQLTAIMLRAMDEELSALGDKATAAAFGPGAGVGEKTRRHVLTLLGKGIATVLDADALTSFADCPGTLFEALRPEVVLTPHAGEFGRLFPDIALVDCGAAAEQAARRSGATVLLKGSATHIAAPDGRAAVNRHATPWLATAGSGDVLTGPLCGVLAGGVEALEAAAVAAWVHGAAGRHGGPGLTADALPRLVAEVMRELCVDDPE